MSSSEDYLDSLLRSMGVPAELASPTKNASKSETKEPEKQDPIVPDAVFTDDSVTEEPAPEEPVVEEPVIDADSVSEDIEAPAPSEDISVPDEIAPETSIEDHFSDILSEKFDVVDSAAEETLVEESPVEDIPAVEASAEEASVEALAEDVQMSLDDLDLDSLLAGVSNDAPVSEEPVSDIPDIDSLLADVSAETPASDEAFTDIPDIDSLLADTGAEEPVIDDSPFIDNPVIDIPEEVPEEETPAKIDHSADIPDLESIINEDPAASDIHIDSAPSLEISQEDYSSETDLTDLMNDLMKQIEPETDEVSEAEPELSLEPEPMPEEDISLEPEPMPESDSEPAVGGDDLDAQLAALLSESGISIDENDNIEITSKDDSEFVDGKPVEDTVSEDSIEIPADISDVKPEASADDVSDFDLDAELAELMKEENESADLPSEEDIDALLNKAKTEGLAEDPDRSEMSLDELLAADSGAASDIGALLDKNDNNEAVGEEIEALLNGSDDTEVPDILGEEGSEGEEVVDKAAEKKRLKEEKKEARRKAKEEKARLKAEAREAKKAKKLGGTVGEENEISNQNAENADMSDVDALLAGAAEAAAAELKFASLNNDESAASSKEPAVDMSASESSSESSPLDETDSLLAEIMGGSFDEEPQEDVSLEKAFDIPSSDESSSEPEIDPLSEIRDLDDEPKKEKKKGLISKILDMLTETDEDEEGSAREIKLSEENATVLEELDAEGEGGKGKKKKKKKGKKDKNAEAAEMDGVGEEVDADAKKGKKKKEKKPKKEKAPAEDEKPSKKLNKKKVIAVFGLCLTILVAVLIVSNLMGSYSVKREARQAYSEGDYQTAYQDLFGQDLNESDEIIFKKSECILRIRLWQREYELLKEESDVKALDSLIQTVNRYPGLYASAVKWGCLDEVQPIYNQLLGELESRYGLTEEEAAEIAMIKKDVDYTRAVYQVVNGMYGAEPETVPEPEPEPEPEPLQDVIPGEEDPGSDIVFVNP